MSESKMSRAELDAESLRLGALIDEASKAGIAAVKEMSKHPLSWEQAREQVRRHHATADHVWRSSNVSKPAKKNF